MPDISVGRVEKDFMIMVRAVLPIKKLLFMIAVALLLNCSPERVDDPIPHGNFPDITITLSNHPGFSDGGFLRVNGGVRGIILYRKAADTYIAFERNCSFQPADACATVDAHSSNLYLEDTCCGSSFRFEDGEPTGGPAWRPLLQYETIFSLNTVVITDAVIN